MRFFRAKNLPAIGILTAVALSLLSCPPPIDEDLLTFAEDKIPPEIEISSPSTDGYYRSVLKVKGRINDSSVKSGDDRGRITEALYGILDNSRISGKVKIGSDGKFSFSVDTASLAGTEVLFITAKDWNDNFAEERVTIQEDTSGPYLKFTSPQNESYYRSEVTVTGEFGNSPDDKNSTDEVSSIEYEVVNTIFQGEPSLVDWGDGTFEFTFDTTVPDVLHGQRLIIVRSENNLGHESQVELRLNEWTEGPHLVLDHPVDGFEYGGDVLNITIEGTVTSEEGSADTDQVGSLTYSIPGIISDEPITFDTDTGFFSVSQSMIGQSGNKVLTVTAEDKNEHQTSYARDLIDTATGPYLLLTSPSDASYYSRYVTVQGYVRDSAGSFTWANIDSLSYVVTGPPVQTDTLTWREVPPDGYYTFTFDTEDISAASFDVEVTAVDFSAKVTERVITLYNDGVGPTITINSPADLSYYSAGDVTIQGTIKDEWGGTGELDLTGSFQIVPAGQTGSFGITAGSGAFSFIFDGASATGDQVITVRANDVNENESDESITLLDDTTAPTVVDVFSTSSDGRYGVDGDTDPDIYVTVEFSEAVIVTGTPTLQLETGSTDRTAQYQPGGSGTNRLVFGYDVKSGDFSSDLDYHDVNALSGDIKDAFENSAVLNLPSLGAMHSLSYNANLIPDGVAPIADHVTSPNDNGRYGIGSEIYIDVVFDEAVTVDGSSPTLRLETGSTDRNAQYDSGDGTSTLRFLYTVVDGDVSPDLNYKNTGSLSTTIEDMVGNTFGDVLPTTGSTNSLAGKKAIVIDTNEPDVDNVTSSNTNGWYGIDSIIEIKVVFSQSVDVTGTPTISLETGDPDRVVDYSRGTGSNTLSFDYTVQEGDYNYDLDYTSTGALDLNGGTIKDNAGNDAILTLATPGATHSLKANKNIRIDGIRPTIQSAVASDVDGAAGPGPGDTVTIVFDDDTNEPTIDKDNIDIVLGIRQITPPVAHTWLDGSGNIGSASWSSADTLVIILSATGGAPTVAVDDGIITDGATIQDIHENGSSTDEFVLTGSFDP